MITIDFDELDSTNAYLKREYSHLEDMTFVSCKNQTSGHGRNNRQWKSENGKNLLFSLLICNKQLINKFNELSVLSAFAIYKVLKKYNLKPKIKWPNDIYVNDKKICGILLESISKEEIECLIIGIGLNINQNIFDGQFNHEPTSMKLETGKDFNINKIKNEVYNYILKTLKLALKNHNLCRNINKISYLNGMKVYAEINGEKKLIKVTKINEDYTLKVDSNGNIIDLNSGEITFHI